MIRKSNTLQRLTDARRNIERNGPLLAWRQKDHEIASLTVAREEALRLGLRLVDKGLADD